MKRIAAMLLTGLCLACGPSPEERLEGAERFWEGTDFTDPTLTLRPETFERRFAAYVESLEDPCLRAARTGPLLAELLRKAEATEGTFLLLNDLCEKYLYAPESPVRNEELYRYALERMIATPWLDDYEKLRPRYQLGMVRRNRLGEPAADFVFTLPDGSRGTLHGIEAPFTILLFGDPDCPACAEAIGNLRYRPLLHLLERSGRLRVVVVYSGFDEDTELWRAHADDYPAGWIVAYDEGARIRYEGLYDLRRTPCLYLLDGEKKVLCKGAYDVAPVARALRRKLFG